MKSKKIQLKKTSSFNDTSIDLPASKSISNRVLILQKLSGGDSEIKNLSEARDTITMKRLLSSSEDELDVLDAGTTMRFLTAYLTATNQKKVLTGTDRMQQRPIKILVDALRQIGAEIDYQRNEGFPPLVINGLQHQKSKEIAIRGDVSSQYISALLMIAPVLPEGLKLELLGRIGSRPYINMTIDLMEHFGVKASYSENNIKVASQKYLAKDITVEPDWSGASYWYSFIALCKKGTLLLKNVEEFSIQGDRIIVDIMADLGVKTEFKPEGALLTKSNAKQRVSFDFTDCPDLAQTIAVVCAAKGIECEMVGLESLKIKETDRVAALSKELTKIGAKLIEEENKWHVIPANELAEKVEIDTYEDHRMAMAFAPLSTLMEVTINDPDVVNKSFPNYWEEVAKITDVK